jgi:hypothetical protein
MHIEKKKTRIAKSLLKNNGRFFISYIKILKTWISYETRILGTECMAQFSIDDMTGYPYRNSQIKFLPYIILK